MYKNNGIEFSNSSVRLLLFGDFARATMPRHQVFFGTCHDEKKLRNSAKQQWKDERDIWDS
jgi:hypothetical protein